MRPALAVALGAVALGAVLAATLVGSPAPPPPPAASFFADGALVLAQGHGPLAVALAAKPEGRRLALQATVLDPQHGLRSGLDAAFAVRTAAGTVRVAARSCGPGCYSALTRVQGPPRHVDVALAGGGVPPGPTAFDLPRAWPPRPALALVRRAERAYARLRSVVTHERLSSGPGQVAWTLYRAARPHRLRFDVRGGASTIIVGTRRWDRDPGGAWERGNAFPRPVRAVAPYWTADVHDATLLRTERVGGRPAWVVSFANPDVPQWFTVWIDRADGRTLRLRMTANAHFMRHVYSDFDEPLRIAPPPGRGPSGG